MKEIRSEDPFGDAQILRNAADNLQEVLPQRAIELHDKANILVKQGHEEQRPLTYSRLDTYTTDQKVARPVNLVDPHPMP